MMVARWLEVLKNWSYQLWLGTAAWLCIPKMSEIRKSCRQPLLLHQWKWQFAARCYIAMHNVNTNLAMNPSQGWAEPSSDKSLQHFAFGKQTFYLPSCINPTQGGWIAFQQTLESCKRGIDLRNLVFRGLWSSLCAVAALISDECAHPIWRAFSSCKFRTYIHAVVLAIVEVARSSLVRELCVQVE